MVYFQRTGLSLFRETEDVFSHNLICLQDPQHHWSLERCNHFPVTILSPLQNIADSKSDVDIVITKT